MGFWLEIVTLLHPGFNDSSAARSTRLTSFVARRRSYYPWHVTAFHGDYKMNRPGKYDRRHADGSCRGSGKGVQHFAISPAGNLSWSSAGWGLRRILTYYDLHRR